MEYFVNEDLTLSW